MAIKLIGNTSNNIAEVTANNQLQVNLPTTLAQSGYAAIAGQSWGSTTGSAQVLRALTVSLRDRARVGLDGILWDDTFNHAQIDAGSYSVNTTTFTTAIGSGYWNLNSGAVNTASAVSRVQTYKTFSIQNAPLEIGFRVKFTFNAQANNGMELGLGYASAITTATDGVYFRMDSSGGLNGCTNYNGSEYLVATGISIVANTYYYLKILVNEMRAEFFVNNVAVCKIDLTDVTASYGSPALCFSRNLPLLARFYNLASAPTNAQSVLITETYVFQNDLQTNRPWSVVMAAQGRNAINVPRGIAAGLAANYANSTVPATATLSNTAAGYATLGGQYLFATVAGAETDYALFAYQVGAAAAPTGANSNLIITGIYITCYNTGAAVATTPSLLQWSIAVGGTALSLATTDSATAGTRRGRIHTLGSHSLPVGAAIGANAPDISYQFAAPLYCEAGTYVVVILKMPVGTATASQTIRGTVGITGHYC